MTLPATIHEIWLWTSALFAFLAALLWGISASVKVPEPPEVIDFGVDSEDTVETKTIRSVQRQALME